jgi:Ni/Co efflux regulator RcnB
MQKLTIAAVTVAFAASGIALPAVASASVAHHAKHHHHAAKAHRRAKTHKKSSIKRQPCDGLGIDIALGPENFCIPL